MDSGAVTKEEEDFLAKEQACYLHTFHAAELDSIVCKYTTTEEILESQLSALVTELTAKDPSQRPALMSIFAGLSRRVLLVFLILLGKDKGDTKARLLFEVGTDSLATEVMSQSQAALLASTILTAAIDVAPRLSGKISQTEYSQTLSLSKDLATAQLTRKILGDQREVNEVAFHRNYGENSRLTTLSGVRLFVARCREKARS